LAARPAPDVSVAPVVVGPEATVVASVVLTAAAPNAFLMTRSASGSVLIVPDG
jgi:hypothetical protein